MERPITKPKMCYCDLIFTTPNSCVFFSFWIIHQATNGSTSRFEFKAFAPLDPFQHALRQDIWNPLCFSLGIGSWLIIQLIYPTFWLTSLVFSTTLQIWLRLPHLSIVGFSQCVCTHPMDPICIHFLCCVHGHECIRTHDVVCDTFVTIVHDANFHLGRKWFHAFFKNMFNFSHWWINIVFTKDGICTLVDIVIADPTWTSHESPLRKQIYKFKANL